MDATTAFEALNPYFYNPDAKLYYSTTDHDGLGASWTQVIFWDMVMDAYQRTSNRDYLKQIYTTATTGTALKSGSSTAT